MDNSHKHWMASLLREHPALLVSGIYVVASTIGMLYSWDYLRLYGINVFNYAQIGDFLLASLKEPFTWLIVLGSMLLVMGDNALSRWVGRNGQRSWLRWYGSRRYRTINYLVAVLLIVVFTHNYAVVKKNQVIDGKGRLVIVQLTDSPSASQFALLGTTSQFVFLYESGSGRVNIHPHESVYTISFIAEKGR